MRSGTDVFPTKFPEDQRHRRRSFPAALLYAAVHPLRPWAAMLINQTPAPYALRLADGWEFLQGSLGGPWEAWHSEEVAVWQPVAMPHCFNAYDGCDPDVPYYRGNGWYRTHVPIANPFPKGRTLLHFEGAGQTTAVYVGEKLAGKHTGGYDEFVFDITDLLPNPSQRTTARRGRTVTSGEEQNEETSRRPHRGALRQLARPRPDALRPQRLQPLRWHVPSRESGLRPRGLVRNRTCANGLALTQGTGEVSIVGTLYNPTGASDSLEVSIEVIDAKGTSVHHSKQTLKPWQGATEITSFTIATPQLWSPADPHLYECRVTLHGGTSSEYVAHETFGIRHTEFVDHGPFKLNGERLLLRGTIATKTTQAMQRPCPTTSSIRRCSSSRTWARTSSASRTTSSRGACSSTATGSASSCGKRFPGAAEASATTPSKRWAAARCAT